MKPGDLVMKVLGSRARDEAGLGLVIDVTYKSGPSYRARDLVLVNESR